MKFDAWVIRQYGRRERDYSEIDLRDAWHAGEDSVSECCAKRGARLQLLREAIRETDWLHFCDENHDATTWFDADGTPTP